MTGTIPSKTEVQGFFLGFFLGSLNTYGSVLLADGHGSGILAEDLELPAVGEGDLGRFNGCVGAACCVIDGR